MTVATAGDLIAAALRSSGVLGVGQTAAAEDAATGLDLLNEVIAGWARDRLVAWRLKEIAIASTGAQSYAMTDRPPRIVSAFARLVGFYSGGQMQLDYPMTIIPSRDVYNEISLKTLGTWPGALYYDPVWPQPVVYVWPIPAAQQFEIHIAYQQPIGSYAALTDALGLPPEHIEAARYILAAKIAMDYGLQPNPGQVARLRGVLARLRAAAIQIKPLEMPAELVRGGASGWGNVFGGAYSVAAAAVDIGNSIDVGALPTSNVGLPVGSLWMNNGVLTVVE